MNRRIFALTGVAIITGSTSGQVIFVDADASGLNDGTSWSDAYTTLDAALNSAGAGDQVWIAEGVYTPAEDYLYVGTGTLGSDPRNYTFEFKPGVEYYGGFAGTEGSIAARSGNETILSGEIGTASQDDNIYCLGRLVHTSRLQETLFDRIVFEKAQNDNLFPNNKDNVEMYSGGLFAVFSGPLQRLKLDLNEVDFRDIVVRQSPEGSRTGALYVEYWNGEATKCTFESIEADNVVFAKYPRVKAGLDQCSFIGNSDYTQSAFYPIQNSQVHIKIDQDFHANEREFNIYNTEFVGCKTLTPGTCITIDTYTNGMSVVDKYGQINIQNCLFKDNESNYGPLLFSEGGYARKLNIVNCTFMDNIVRFESGSTPPKIYEEGTCVGVEAGTDAIVRNSVAWGNVVDLSVFRGTVADEFAAFGAISGSMDVAWTNAESHVYVGSGNMSTDPLLQTDATLDQDSPSIDAGSDADVLLDIFDYDLDSDYSESVPYDLAHMDRFVNTINSNGTGGFVDMGCFEFQEPCIADFNQDGIVDSQDQDDFAAAYSAGDPSADINGDGVINYFDISAFNAAYMTGCDD